MTSNEVDSLWPDDLFTTSLRAPATILKEQANILSESSQRLIIGVVKSSVPRHAGDDLVVHSLRARVPDLGDYEVELLQLSHRPTLMYPVEAGEGGADDVIIKDEPALVSWLRIRLRSSFVVNTIKTLVAQVRDPDARPPGGRGKAAEGPVSGVDYGDIPF